MQLKIFAPILSLQLKIFAPILSRRLQGGRAERLHHAQVHHSARVLERLTEPRKLLETKT